MIGIVLTSIGGVMLTPIYTLTPTVGTAFKTACMMAVVLAVLAIFAALSFAALDWALWNPLWPPFRLQIWAFGHLCNVYCGILFLNLRKEGEGFLMDKKADYFQGDLGVFAGLIGGAAHCSVFYIQLYYRGWNNDLFLRLFWILLEPDRRLRRGRFRGAIAPLLPSAPIPHC